MRLLCAGLACWVAVLPVMVATGPDVLVLCGDGAGHLAIENRNRGCSVAGPGASVPASPAVMDGASQACADIPILSGEPVWRRSDLSGRSGPTGKIFAAPGNPFGDFRCFAPLSAVPGTAPGATVSADDPAPARLLL